jgi:hypothetical protein
MVSTPDPVSRVGMAQGPGISRSARSTSVLHDKDAATTGYVRVIDESSEDYLYPADYFVFVELPQQAKWAWRKTRGPATRRGSSNKPLQRACARVARAGR